MSDGQRVAASLRVGKWRQEEEAAPSTARKQKEMCMLSSLLFIKLGCQLLAGAALVGAGLPTPMNTI